MHKQGNISIFVIFILLASSLLGLLTLILVQKLIRYQGVALGYYQSYYSAKAGIETLLALHKARGVGFSYTIPSELFIENFQCLDCTVQAQMQARSAFIRDQHRLEDSCGSGFVLGTGETKIIPLFYDNGTGGLASLFFQLPTYQSLHQQINNIQAQPMTRDSNITLTMGIFILDGNALAVDGSFIQEYVGPVNAMISWFANAFFNYASSIPGLQQQGLQHYLLLANTSDTPVQLCIGMAGLYINNNTLAQDVAYLTSIGSFAAYRVGLEAILDSTIPQFLLQTYSDL